MTSPSRSLQQDAQSQTLALRLFLTVSSTSNHASLVKNCLTTQTSTFSSSIEHGNFSGLHSTDCSSISMSSRIAAVATCSSTSQLREKIILDLPMLSAISYTKTKLKLRLRGRVHFANGFLGLYHSCISCISLFSTKYADLFVR